MEAKERLEFLLSNEPAHLDYLHKILRIDALVCRLTTNQIKRGETDISGFYTLMNLITNEYRAVSFREGARKFILLLQETKVSFNDSDDAKLISLESALAIAHLSPWIFFDDDARVSKILIVYLSVLRPAVRSLAEECLNINTDEIPF